MTMDEINVLRDQFVAQLSPLRIYLFGSYVEGTDRENSDFDFYIVMRDGTSDLADLTAKAYRSIRGVKRHSGMQKDFADGALDNHELDVAE